MLKCGCVFDRKELNDFFKDINIEEKYNDYTMYFGLYKDAKLVALNRMYPEEKRCRIEVIMKRENILEMEEEFLLKSGINFALTFNVKELIISNSYKKYLSPMGFIDLNDKDMVGDVDKVDFPHHCGGH